MNEEVLTIKESIEELSKDFLPMIDDVVQRYTNSMDILITDIHEGIQNSDELSDADLEFFLMQLSTMLYLLGGKLEKTGTLEDIAKMLRQEKYNKSYLKQQSDASINNVKITVSQLQANAEEDAKYNTLMQTIYSRVYRQIKYKLDAAFELVSIMKKIMSKRIQSTVRDPNYTPQNV